MLHKPDFLVLTSTSIISETTSRVARVVNHITYFVACYIVFVLMFYVSMVSISEVLHSLTLLAPCEGFLPNAVWFGSLLVNMVLCNVLSQVLREIVRWAGRFLGQFVEFVEGEDEEDEEWQ
jgi:amino acid permease